MRVSAPQPELDQIVRRLRLPALRIDPGKLRVRRQGNGINAALRSRFLLEASAPPGSSLASIPAQEAASVEAARQATATPVRAVLADIVAHDRNVRDLGGACGAWIVAPERGSWIEGFCITPRQGVVPADIEYHVVLDFGRPSPWASGGEFCGTHGMTMPLRGICVRLRNAATATYQCVYSARFQDGSTVGPLQAGEVCQSTSLAPPGGVSGRDQSTTAIALPREASGRDGTKDMAFRSAGEPTAVATLATLVVFWSLTFMGVTN